MWQECVLLRFVEAMDLVNENDGASSVLTSAFGIGHHLLDLFDPGEHGGELDELRLGHIGDDLGERGFAGAGRSPEDQGTGVVALDLHAQRLARADQMFLADIFVQCARAHAVGERTSCIGGAAWIRNGLKQTHGIELRWL